MNMSMVTFQNFIVISLIVNATQHCDIFPLPRFSFTVPKKLLPSPISFSSTNSIGHSVLTSLTHVEHVGQHLLVLLHLSKHRMFFMPLRSFSFCYEKFFRCPLFFSF